MASSTRVMPRRGRAGGVRLDCRRITLSTTGALLIASAGEDERLRLKSLLTQWGLSLVIVGPLVAVIILLLLGRP